MAGRTVSMEAAVVCGLGSLALGLGAAFIIAPDAQDRGAERVASAPASFNWQHEASGDDAFSPDGGFNAFLWTWPDGSQDWCFHYTQASSNESTQPVCKPVPTDYNTAPGNTGSTMEDHQ